MGAYPRWHYVLGRRLWHVRSTELTLLPRLRLSRSDLLILLAGIMLFFRHIEFPETDVFFARIWDRDEDLMSLGSATLRACN